MDSEAKKPEAMSELEVKAKRTGYKIITFAGPELPESYKGVIYSRWLRSLRFGNEYFRLVDSDSYYSSYHRYIDFILAHIETTVNLAVLGDDPDVVLGWSVNRGTTLHYVHVQADYRKRGIGKSLVLAEVKVITHLTKTGLSIWSAKFPKAHFNPF